MLVLLPLVSFNGCSGALLCVGGLFWCPLAIFAQTGLAVFVMYELKEGHHADI